MSVDTIGDFLTILRNGIMASKHEIVVPYSNFKYEIAKILKEEGFINDYIVIVQDDHKKLKIFLRYVNGESAIHEITRVSRPGRRLYENSSNLKSVIGGLGISILTTSRGIMTNKKAKELSLGGEVICTVW